MQGVYVHLAGGINAGTYLIEQEMCEGGLCAWCSVS